MVRRIAVSILKFFARRMGFLIFPEDEFLRFQDRIFRQSVLVARSGALADAFQRDVRAVKKLRAMTDAQVSTYHHVAALNHR